MQGQFRLEEFRVLLVEADTARADLLQAALGEARGAMGVRHGLFAVTQTDALAPALERLVQDPFDAVLLDLELPDAHGLEALARVRTAAPGVPVVVITGSDDAGLALQAIRAGAQDCLPADRLEASPLPRIIRHAIARQRAELELFRHARNVEAANMQIEEQSVELRARADRLDQINRELADFAYIASHDLKEPLRGISAYCEMLLEDYRDRLDEEGRRRLHALTDMCNRLAKLIENLLAYCRVGHVPPPEEEVDLNAILDEVLETLRPAIDQRDALIRRPRPLPAVRGDAMLIGMVLGTLISNGLKFNESRRPCVEIGSLAGDPPTIYVRDNGIGIDPKHHETIFALFRRLHSRKKYEGTGAGLTIVRKIVEAYGGKVWLESEPGRGSTFYFTLAPTEKAAAAKSPGRPPHWTGRAAHESTAHTAVES